MEIGHFYYIKDQYFLDFPDSSLMQNKDADANGLHGRPCYLCFTDEENDIFWFIPISSRVEKYKKIYDKKVEKYKHCDTIQFANVLGKERAFLIQNMCPVTLEYIDYEYKSSDGSPVEIQKNKAFKIIRKAKRVLQIAKNDNSKIVFSDIIKIEEALKNRVLVTCE